MKINKILAFGSLAALATLSATLLFQNSITRADDHGKRGDDDERGDHDQRINNRFVILLEGVYKPVALAHGPEDNLGLTTVDLNDGSFIKVKIFPISGLPGDKDEDKAIGTFYVRMGALCVPTTSPGDHSVRSLTLRPAPILQGFRRVHRQALCRGPWMEPSNWISWRRPGFMSLSRMVISTW